MNSCIDHSFQLDTFLEVHIKNLHLSSRDRVTNVWDFKKIAVPSDLCLSLSIIKFCRLELWVSYLTF